MVSELEGSLWQHMGILGNILVYWTEDVRGTSAWEVFSGPKLRELLKKYVCYHKATETCSWPVPVFWP